MFSNETDWEKRSEWHLIAGRLDELADALAKSDITALDNNGVRNINVVRKLIEATHNLANYYREISDNIVSK